MRRRAAVGVDDDLAAGQAGVAVGTADDEIARRIDQPFGLLRHHAGRQDLQRIGLDDGLDIRRRQAVLVLMRHQDLEDARGQAVFVQHRDLRLGIGFKAVFADVASRGQAVENIVRPLQRRRGQFGGLAGGVAEHDALVAGAFVLVATGIDAHGDVGGLGMQVAGIVGHRPVKALLGVANIPHGVPDLVFKATDNVADLFVAGAAFARQDDTIGGDHGLARNARFGILAQEGVDHDVGDAVGNLVGVTFGDAFAGEYVG